MTRRTEAEAVARAQALMAMLHAQRGQLGYDSYRSPLDRARDAYITGAIEVEEFEQRLDVVMGVREARLALTLHRTTP